MDKSDHIAKSLEFYKTRPCTVHGVLGSVNNDADINGTVAFLKQVEKDVRKSVWSGSVCDCCGGIGRVTSVFLDMPFERIVLFDWSERMLDKAKEEITDKRVEIGLSTLQDFEFDRPYDLIWVSYTLPHIPDDDLVIFLKKASASLSKDGVIILKENLTFGEPYVWKPDKGVVLRSYFTWLKLFEKAGVERVATRAQGGFDNSYPVLMMAVRPVKKKSD